MKIPDWKIFEQYIVERLKEIDPYCSRTPGSGNKGIKSDVKTNLPLQIECKQRNTKDITIRMDVWEKLKGTLPFYLNKIPILALQNKDKKRFVVLELDSFINLFIEYWKLKNENNT